MEIKIIKAPPLLKHVPNDMVNAWIGCVMKVKEKTTYKNNVSGYNIDFDEALDALVKTGNCQAALFWCKYFMKIWRVLDSHDLCFSSEICEVVKK